MLPAYTIRLPLLCCYVSRCCFTHKQRHQWDLVCLFATRRYLKIAVPVPEIYGSRIDGDPVFLYIEAISGRSLEQAWEGIGESECLRICSELRKILNALRRLIGLWGFSSRFPI